MKVFTYSFIMDFRIILILDRYIKTPYIFLKNSQLYIFVLFNNKIDYDTTSQLRSMFLVLAC